MTTSKDLVMQIFADKIRELQEQAAKEDDPAKHRAILFAWATLIELESKFYLETVRSIA